MKKLKLIGVAIMSVCLNRAEAGTWTTLDAPGAARTEAYGINGNNIVGWNGSTNSFLYNGSWSTLAFPGAIQTTAHAINSRGNIVGWYVTAASYPQSICFAFDGTTNWTSFSPPGAVWSAANGIDGNNVVGGYDTGSGTRAFLFDGLIYTTFVAPGALSTEATGISGNLIVGWYSTNNVSGDDHGFLYDGTNFTTLDVPGATETDPFGIDGNNIIGSYTDASGDHAFIYDGTNWTLLNAPGASETHGSSMYGNNVVGNFVDGTGIHGFIYSITETNPPVITQQPTPSQTVAVGSAVTLSVVATNAPLGYQWYFGTNLLSGDTNATLTLANVQSSQSGSYTVTVSNVISTITSDAAVLSILPSLSIYMVPSISMNATVGTTNIVEFVDAFGPTNDWQALATIVITNNPQWYFDTNAIGQPQRFYQLMQTN